MLASDNTCVTVREFLAGGLPRRRASKLLQVPVELRLDKHDAIQEFLDDLILVLVVLLRDLLPLHLRLAVDGSLRGLGVACVLYISDGHT